MLIGRDLEKKIINRFKEKNILAGGFLFFGEPQIGKFSFAKENTSLLEKNPSVCQERLIIKSDESKIGIDEIRAVKSFLRKRPIMSFFRSVIINDAEKMTEEAQNAALKIVEEPPSYGIIIFIAKNTEDILPTLSSRLRKIYFAPVKEKEIAFWLSDCLGVEKSKSENIASCSFGRPGFALEILNNPFFKDLNDEKNINIQIPNKFESLEEYDNFIKLSLIKLYNDKINKSGILKKFLNRIELSGRFNTNKKLQIQSIPWTR